MRFIIIVLFLVSFGSTSMGRENLGSKVKNLAILQSKRISKIIEKEGACTSLHGHLVNTCKSAVHSWTLDVHTKVTNRLPITLEYIQHLRSYVKKQEKF